MTTHEFTQLRRWELGRQRFNSFRSSVTSRRSAKHPTVGKVYKDSRVTSEVGLERVFNKPGWVKAAQVA